MRTLLLAALVLIAPASPARAANEPLPSPPAGACTTTRDCAGRLGRGNVCAEGRCAAYFDRRDAYDLLGLRKAAAAAPPVGKLLLAAIPAIGYSPASGVQLGLAGTLGIFLGDSADTTISSATGSLLVTTERQLMLQVAATAMTSRNRWELLGDWRFLLFNQNTYGLGTGEPPLARGVSIGGWGELEAMPGAQPMDFNLVRFHQSALRLVSGNLYLGGGLRFDRHFEIEDHRLDLSAATPVVTSHYAYSRIYGFDPGAYTASGISLETISDSRDSTIAPYRGTYALLRLTAYPTWLGSTQEATEISVEGRTYVGLADHPRNVLALWVLGSGVTSGHLPYLALPASGWHARSSMGRGYVQGRFRGTGMVYAEAEWRFPLGSTGLLGGTVFANAQTFSRPTVILPESAFVEPGEELFETIRPAAGGGLRVMLLKQSRTALRVDVAAGKDSLCFYLGAGEAF